MSEIKTLETNVEYCLHMVREAENRLQMAKNLVKSWRKALLIAEAKLSGAKGNVSYVAAGRGDSPEGK